MNRVVGCVVCPRSTGNFSQSREKFNRIVKLLRVTAVFQEVNVGRRLHTAVCRLCTHSQIHL